MRTRTARVLGVAALAACTTIAIAAVNHMYTVPGGIVLPPRTLPGKAIAHPGRDYSTFILEHDNPDAGSQPMWVCGRNAGWPDGGFTSAVISQSCHKRCLDLTVCPFGPGFSGDVKQEGGPVAFCDGPGTDAGCRVKLSFGR
jgi:hypothetical protein